MSDAASRNPEQGPDNPRRGKFLPFSEARTFARSLGLRSEADWHRWAKTEDRPKDVPADPPKAYASEWQGWSDWLGTGSP